MYKVDLSVPVEEGAGYKVQGGSDNKVQGPENLSKKRRYHLIFSAKLTFLKKLFFGQANFF